MKKILTIFITIFIAAFVISSCSKKKGCTDPNSLNYDSQAEENDGSCQYKKGCMDSAAVNYDPEAMQDDGSCQYLRSGCTDPNSITYDSLAQVDDGSCQYGGIGGNVNLIASALHHIIPVFGPVGYPDSVFIKFNSQTNPGISPLNYDLSSSGIEGEDHVVVNGLKPGKYFIMMTGFDSTINERVTGGMPFIITQTSGQFPLTVAVTE